MHGWPEADTEVANLLLEYHSCVLPACYLPLQVGVVPTATGSQLSLLEVEFPCCLPSGLIGGTPEIRGVPAPTWRLASQVPSVCAMTHITHFPSQR